MTELKGLVGFIRAWVTADIVVVAGTTIGSHTKVGHRRRLQSNAVKESAR